MILITITVSGFKQIYKRLTSEKNIAIKNTGKAFRNLIVKLCLL